MLRVADHGPGIAREHLPRLSERFYRVEGQKSGERLGTGLGLAIVKHIINRHRGGLAIESLEGAGRDLYRLPSRGCNKTVTKPSHSDSNRRATFAGGAFRSSSAVRPLGCIGRAYDRSVGEGRAATWSSPWSPRSRVWAAWPRRRSPTASTPSRAATCRWPRR